MATSFKAQAIAHKLADLYKARGYTPTESFDTDNNPLISIGPGTAGNKNAIVKVLPTSWPLANDILGNAALQYTPHTIQIVTEADSAGTGIATATAWQFLFDIMGQATLMGCHVDTYQSANGVAPSTAAITGAPKSSFDPDLFHALISQQ